VNNISEIDFDFQYENRKILYATVLAIIENFIQILLRIKCEEVSASVCQCKSESDQQVIMYVSGYLLRALKNQCSRSKSNDMMMMTIIEDLLNKNKNGRDTFCTKYREWTVKVDRGGLLHTCDDFFLLVRNMEITVNRHISHSLSHDLLKKQLLLNCALTMLM